MKISKLSFTGNHFLTFPFILIGFFLIIAAIGVIVKSVFWALGLFILGALLLSTHYGTEIDLENSKIKEYTWILGWKNGKAIPFHEIEKVYMNTRRYSQRLNHKSLSNNIYDREYQGYLRLKDQENILLKRSKNGKKLEKALKKLARDLSCGYEDRCS